MFAVRVLKRFESRLTAAVIVQAQIRQVTEDSDETFNHILFLQYIFVVVKSIGELVYNSAIVPLDVTTSISPSFQTRTEQHLTIMHSFMHSAFI